MDYQLNSQNALRLDLQLLINQARRNISLVTTRKKQRDIPRSSVLFALHT